MLEKRIKQMEETEMLSDYEHLYYEIGHDLGFLNDWMGNNIAKVQAKRQEIREKNPEFSIAALDREFELTEEYLMEKKYKYNIAGLVAMKNAIRVKVESMRAESRGQY